MNSNLKEIKENHLHEMRKHQLNYKIYNQITTIEWIAPILAHASKATDSSTIIGIYIATLSPFFTPKTTNQHHHIMRPLSTTCCVLLY